MNRKAEQNENQIIVGSIVRVNVPEYNAHLRNTLIGACCFIRPEYQFVVTKIDGSNAGIKEVGSVPLWGVDNIPLQFLTHI